MRIVLDYRPALRARTGVGELVHELARALLAEPRPADERIALFTSSWKERPLPDLGRELPGAEVIDRRIPVRALTWAWNRHGWPPVEWLAGTCDVVHSLSPLLIPSIAAAQVVTIHDLDFLRHPERTSGETQRDFAPLAAAHVQRADQVVVPSRHTGANVVDGLAVASARVSVCSPGAPEWAEPIWRARQRPGSTPAGDHLLFIGTLEPRKNVGALIAAYAGLRAVVPTVPPLVLAGKPTAHSEAWRREVDEAGVGDRVVFTGYVDEPTRRDLYARAIMLILPSHDEGFGFPVLEAMACGVPVVVSNRGALPELVGDAADPVEPSDVDGLRARMQHLLSPEHASAAATRGRARATTYRWAQCAVAARKAYAAARARRRG